MGLNLERMRSLLRALGDSDPDADARGQLISGGVPDDRIRARAMALLGAELVRDPYELMSGPPPAWLLELSSDTRTGATLLFDSRLTDLTGRAVDDLLSQGCTADQLITWLANRGAQHA